MDLLFLLFEEKKETRYLASFLYHLSYGFMSNAALLSLSLSLSLALVLAFSHTSFFLINILQISNINWENHFLLVTFVRKEKA